MKRTWTIVAALGLASGALANDHSDAAVEERADVIAAADAFFEALRDPDKTALADELLAEAVIFVHDRRDPDNARTMIVPAGTHLEAWLTSAAGVDEYMNYESVLIDGDMAHVWGPYVFLLNGTPTHCGINSMSMVKTEDGWKVGNTSFTMTAVEECATLGAPEVPAQ
ncbi:hypothetical protein [Altererythrobacter lutimaris]|uniref:DUF4440 domain-containing protein n=1 Tax=Altererythrobacter lutimaris TaxID=2743979 RepID=A0A850H9S4_9SPHN|nr:hypothetical protein [Altererythrobacter lutimaris]NVE95917.1 hypothetical protein [Altererythrobacter lutimaris]